MKKYNFLLLLQMLLGIINYTVISADPINTTSTITWKLDLGTSGQVAAFSTGTSDYFSSNWVDIGTNLKYNGVSTTYSITYTKFQPYAQATSADAANLVSFNFRPTTGLSFTPTSITFDCVRYGTDNGSIDVVWKSSDGSTQTIATALKPARDNSGAGTHATYDLSTLSIPASTGDCALYIYIYGLANTKSAGLANIVINGNVTGEIVNVTKYTLSMATSPETSGTVSGTPVGTSFDEGTSLTVRATRSFGYNFSHWTNDAGDTLSRNNDYTFTILQNTSLHAVFKPINTYSLTINTSGGAQSYMVSANPAGTVVSGLLMYEEGTTVTLTAGGNHILTFTNWLTGATNPVLTVPMSQNQNITAVYSAVDYITGWDFYKSGNSGRPADFYSTTENQAAALILRKADGTTNSWLDKSLVAAAGYYNRGSAVNWKPLADQYYFQISFNAKDFTDIKVAAGLLYNYNAYTIQKCEYSLDGTNFTTLGNYTMTNGGTWYDSTFSLPADANHIDKVYVRWIPDYTSAVSGTTAANNDGTSISNIYVTAKEAIYNDGAAPALSCSIPTDSTTNASATGKVVLTFDEKVMLITGFTGVATLGSKALTPVVSGKTITFNYSGLDYNTDYTFTLPAKSVSDLAGNILDSAITITFKTRTRPTVTKKLFDFVVGVDGDFKAALAAASAASSSGERFRIFFPKGQYNIGANTGDANQMTTIALPKISYIGENTDSVIIYNKSINEAINTTATMAFTNAVSEIYMQDISLMNKMDYRTGSLVGRGVTLWDQGTKNIYKNVNLLSNQDTYYSGTGKNYFEGGSIHGTVDFICGGGDIFFNECTLYLEERSGNCITAPATSTTWGYVFSNCTIDGFDINNGSYRLGRPWNNSPKAVYINTRMKLLPVSKGWGDPMNVVPSAFAEYNSTTSEGAVIDLTGRRTTYTFNTTTVTLNPVLSSTQAAQYTVENVLGGTDTWQPQVYTEQAVAPVIMYNGTTISWADNDYVLCWEICKNGSFVKFVTTNSYTVPSDAVTGTVYTVRAANEMGGLSTTSNSITIGTKNPTIIDWNNPQSITAGTALSDVQLNAKAYGNTSSAVYSSAIGTVLTAGTHELTVSFAEDAYYLSGSKTVTIEVVGPDAIKYIDNEKITIYPNPLVDNIINIAIPSCYKGKEHELTIISMNGTVLLTKHLAVSTSSVNLNNLSPGTYLLQISISDKKVTKQFIKK